MLNRGLILTAQRPYAQTMREALLSIGQPGCRVDVELDALRAMQLVPQQYDLILLDALLDAMDGLQLLLLMKQQAPTTKFIIVSDAHDEGSRAHAYQNGADFFLRRPTNPQALALAMENVRSLVQPVRRNATEIEEQEGVLTRLADVIKTRCLSGDSVLLLVRGNAQSGDIFIYRGAIYHAQYPGKGGETAFYDILQWDGGTVRVKELKLNHVPPRTIESSYLALLAKAETGGALEPGMQLPTAEFKTEAGSVSGEGQVPDVVLEAPPLAEAPAPTAVESVQLPELISASETPLPALNSHWKINLMGELVEGSQVADPDRCSFITYFIYRKMADVAVALELDYFDQMTLLGPHLQQVLVANNMGVQHGVFDTAWTSEANREQFVKWCCEQSL